MKVLIVFPFSKTSTGISSYTFSIIDALKNSKEISCDVASNYDEWKSECDSFKKINYYRGYNILSKLLLIFSLDFFLLKSNMLFFRLNNIKVSHYDYVFFTTAIPLFYTNHPRNVVSVHDLMHKYEPNYKEVSSFLKFSYREKLYKLVSTNTQTIIVDSNLGKKQFIESYPIVVSNSVKILPFIAPSYIYDFLDSDDKTFDRENNIFYPASFWPHKNHIKLLKAFLLLKEEGYSFKLIFCGKKNSFRRKIESLIIKNKISEFVEIYDYLSVSELINFYKKSHALIMPTFFGPTNIPPIEALLFNCPIIVSNNYAMPEQFEEAAIYIDPNSVQSIVNGIKLSYNFTPSNINEIKIKFSKEMFSNKLLSLFKY